MGGRRLQAWRWRPSAKPVAPGACRWSRVGPEHSAPCLAHACSSMRSAPATVHALAVDVGADPFSFAQRHQRPIPRYRIAYAQQAALYQCAMVQAHMRCKNFLHRFTPLYSPREARCRSCAVRLHRSGAGRRTCRAPSSRFRAAAPAHCHRKRTASRTPPRTGGPALGARVRHRFPTPRRIRPCTRPPPVSAPRPCRSLHRIAACARARRRCCPRR